LFVDLGTRIALQRPDGYVFGSADDPKVLLRLLCDQLG